MNTPKKYHRGGKKRTKGSRGKNSKINYGLFWGQSSVTDLGLPDYEVKKRR